MAKRSIIENDRQKIEAVISELDQKKNETLQRTWEKVNHDFASIFSTLLPGATVKLEPPEGGSVVDGLEVCFPLLLPFPFPLFPFFCLSSSLFLFSARCLLPNGGWIGGWSSSSLSLLLAFPSLFPLFRSLLVFFVAFSSFASPFSLASLSRPCFLSLCPPVPFSSSFFFLFFLQVKVALGGIWKDSLSELSGGQRSLLALSLILSLLLFKPAPMYILDEVDAALDLSHTQNIGIMLKTHFSQSQFIIVSLKEGMFSNANVVFRAKFIDGVSTVTRVVLNQGGAGAGAGAMVQRKGKAAAAAAAAAAGKRATDEEKKEEGVGAGAGAGVGAGAGGKRKRVHEEEDD